jgi:hypothetical protein
MRPSPRTLPPQASELTKVNRILSLAVRADGEIAMGKAVLGSTSLVKALAGCAFVVGCSASGENGATGSATAQTIEQPPVQPSSGNPRQVAAATLPPEIARWVSGLRSDCRDAGGRVTSEQLTPKVVDFNGDGRPDYVLSAAETIGCSAGETIFLQGQVPTWTFFVSTPRGYVDNGDSVASLGLEMATHEGRPVVIVHSGGPGAYERPWEKAAYGWNGRAIAPLAYFGADGRRVNADGTALGGGGWSASGFPESLTPGFYAESCWPPDPNGLGYVYLTNRNWQEWDAELPISRIERNGTTRFRFHTFLEDEEGNRSPDVIDIQTQRFGEFVELVDGERGRSFTRCEEREVPDQVRRDMTGR